MIPENGAKYSKSDALGDHLTYMIMPTTEFYKLNVTREKKNQV